jgi:hypothetical protein
MGFRNRIRNRYAGHFSILKMSSELNRLKVQEIPSLVSYGDAISINTAVDQIVNFAIIIEIINSI